MLSLETSQVRTISQHTIVFYVVLNFVTALVLGFTPANSLLRLALLPILVLAAYHVVLSCPTVLYPYPWAGFAGGNINTSLFNYLEVVLLSRWSYEAKGPTSPPTPDDQAREDRHQKKALQAPSSTTRHDFWRRLRFGYFVTTSNRKIGTTYKNTPPFSAKDPAYVLSRWSFCLPKTCLILFTVLIIDLASQESQPLQVNAKMFAEAKVHIFTGSPYNLLSRQIVTRLATVLGYWFCTAIVIDAFASTFNLFFFALHLEDVEVYRPNFGSVAESYTVRGFWG